MEKVVPSAATMKPKAKKKDQYLLKRRDDARAPPPPSMPLPDSYPASMPLALDDGPPGYPVDPPTPPLPSSTSGEEEFMLQRRAPPPPPAAPGPVALPSPGQVVDTAAPADDASRKKVGRPKKKRETEEPADAVSAAAGEPKKKKKKKKLAELNGVVASAAPSSGAGGKPGFSPPKIDLDGLDLKQVISDLQNLPLVPSYAVRRISDDARSFVLAFRSKCYKKSYENDPSEENKKGSESKLNATAGPPAKMKPAVKAGEPAKAGVKRGPSDRQEELATKKKAKLNKIKTLATDKKAAGLELRDAAATTAFAASRTPAAAQPRAGMEKKTDAIVSKKKEPAAAPAIKTPSPTALMMKFPLKSTLPSVASLKARFARFGPLDVDGIRVYWKSHMCRVIYKFQSDAEVALKYARGNAIFGQVAPHYYLRGVESAGGDPGPDPAPPQRTELRLMETAPFRPGSSGNGAPLQLSRAVPARTVVGQPKSILKKSTDDGAPAALREAPRVKFMLDAGDSKLESPTAPASGSGGPDAALAIKSAKSVGFAPPPLQPPARPAQQQPHLQPPARPAQQLPRQPVTTQALPPPPPLQQHQPYAPRHTDAPMAFSVHPSLPLPPPPPYQPRHVDGMLAFPGQQPPLPPYPPRAAAGFPGHLQQQYHPNHPQLGISASGEDTPAWKRDAREFEAEAMRIMLGIAKLVEPLTDKNGNFPYHLFRPA
ncbi:hypothetical protein GUJ93_ZPchr0010g10406 [Zizania palustris]|uniref:Uncharacterized protein n=1 Tax=Zizania palustris TaxID=103762 RepID=A0A8J6BG83_ZIZPA|nr:hypothetical protein GUJ93_ZPchr0010g10406 [Zizania palustris]